MYLYSRSFDFVELFKSLSDENRLRIIRLLLDGIFNVAEIHFIIGGKQSNVSHHLKILQKNSLISCKKEGLQNYYRLSDFKDNRLLKSVVQSIKENQQTINFFSEDMKRKELIIMERRNFAEKYFNDIGGDIDALQEEAFKNLYTVEDTLPLLNGKYKTIVDIGCGSGKNLTLLSAYAEKIIGVDISQKMLQLSDHICKKRGFNYELINGDFLNLPIEDNSADVAFVNMTLHHISTPELALKEINRILTKKGKMLLIDLLAHSDYKMRDKQADLWLGFNEDYIVDLCALHNFKILKKIIKKNNISDKKVIIVYAEKK